VVIYLERDVNDLHMVRLMPLPSVGSFFIEIQIGSTFLVPAYPDCPGKQPIIRVFCFCGIRPTWRHSSEDCMLVELSVAVCCVDAGVGADAYVSGGGPATVH